MASVFKYQSFYKFEYREDFNRLANILLDMKRMYEVKKSALKSHYQMQFEMKKEFNPKTFPNGK